MFGSRSSTSRARAPTCSMAASAWRSAALSVSASASGRGSPGGIGDTDDDNPDAAGSGAQVGGDGAAVTVDGTPAATVPSGSASGQEATTVVVTDSRSTVGLEVTEGGTGSLSLPGFPWLLRAWAHE